MRRPPRPVVAAFLVVALLVPTDGWAATTEPGSLADRMVATISGILASARPWPASPSPASPPRPASDDPRLDPASGAARTGSEVAPLPRCRLRDERTRFHEVRHWRITLLDTGLRLPRRYEPWDLVPVSRAGIAGSGRVRKVVIDDLRALSDAARRAGKPLAVRSAYRSFATQAATFDGWVRRAGYEEALRFSARPGHSEHQLGTTLDFTTAPGTPLSTTFGDSPAGRWLRRHGPRYGFVLSYPKGKRRESCYGYEPWHWRYVGRELAAEIAASGQVPRRFLWERYESLP